MFNHVQFTLDSIARVALACVIAASLSACSSFNSEWSRWTELEARPAPVSPTADGISGRWEGKWVSVPSGHEGALRCIITEAPMPPSSGANDPRPYRFSFSATWGPGIVSDYEIVMSTRQEGSRTLFEGEMDLGWLAGVYQSKGHIEGTRFLATYTSKNDHGTFEMSRPK